MTEAVADALADYAQNDTNRERIRAAQAHALSGHGRWGNYFTRERFLAELSTPSPSLLSAVDEMRQKLIGALDLPTTPRRRVRRGLDWGDELDADRFLAREPSAWERSVREPHPPWPRRTVTIGCNIPSTEAALGISQAEAALGRIAGRQQWNEVVKGRKAKRHCLRSPAPSTSTPESCSCEDGPGN